MLLKKRNKYYKFKTKHVENKNYEKLYKEYQAKAKKLKFFLKNKYYSSQIEKNIACNRKIWNVLNNSIFNKSNEKDGVKQNKHKDIIINGKKEIANIMNDYFINMVEINESESINAQIVTEYDIQHPYRNTECTENEILLIIQKLNNNST